MAAKNPAAGKSLPTQPNPTWDTVKKLVIIYISPGIIIVINNNVNSASLPLKFIFENANAAKMVVMMVPAVDNTETSNVLPIYKPKFRLV